MLVSIEFLSCEPQVVWKAGTEPFGLTSFSAVETPAAMRELGSLNNCVAIRQVTLASRLTARPRKSGAGPHECQWTTS